MAEVTAMDMDTENGSIEDCRTRVQSILTAVRDLPLAELSRLRNELEDLRAFLLQRWRETQDLPELIAMHQYCVRLLSQFRGNDLSLIRKTAESFLRELLD